MRAILDILRDTRGATALEYGLILAVIVVAMMVGLNSVAGKTTNIWNGVAQKVART